MVARGEAGGGARHRLGAGACVRVGGVDAKVLILCAALPTASNAYILAVRQDVGVRRRRQRGAQDQRGRVDAADAERTHQPQAQAAAPPASPRATTPCAPADPCPRSILLRRRLRAGPPATRSMASRLSVWSTNAANSRPSALYRKPSSEETSSDSGPGLPTASRACRALPASARKEVGERNHHAEQQRGSSCDAGRAEFFLPPPPGGACVEAVAALRARGGQEAVRA